MSLTQGLLVEFDTQGPAAPPRSNGELIFSEPWESRVFGVTMSLFDAGSFEWAAFQHELIDAVRRWESSHGANEEYRYWVCWLDALEHLIAALGVFDGDQLRRRAEELGSRPAGHDHRHDADHSHEGEQHHDVGPPRCVATPGPR